MKRFALKSKQRRNYLIRIIDNLLGMSVIIPDAGYFFVANITSFKKKLHKNYKNNNKMSSCCSNDDDDNFKKEDTRDVKFIKWMIKNIGLEGYPLSAYFVPRNKRLGEDGVRFTFIKVN